MGGRVRFVARAQTLPLLIDQPATPDIFDASKSIVADWPKSKGPKQALSE
jgi:hypothetical protein